MRAVYLTGERIYLRAMVASDKEVAAAWFPGPFPVNAPSAEAWLKERHGEGNFHTRHYIIARTDDDSVVGGVALAGRSGRAGFLTFSLAPWLTDADAVRAEALRLLARWARDDLEYMVLTVPIAEDETETRAAAEGLGLVVSARLREFVARPGHRVDQLLYQALNAPWVVPNA